MQDVENQMGLFETGALPEIMPQAQATPRPQPVPEPVAKRAAAASPGPGAGLKSGSANKARSKGIKAAPAAKAPAKAVSGLVPDGDVRLTANIRQDLHLKLKIASAYRRTTIGEIIEELIEKYV